MSEANPPVPAQATAPQSKYQASSLVVPPRPDECGFPHREDEFQILCEGEVSEAKAGRDLCVGAFLGALLGFVGVLATTDWVTIWQPERRVPFILWSAVLLLIMAASGAGSVIYQVRLKRTRNDSAYSRLRTRIADWFRRQAL